MVIWNGTHLIGTSPKCARRSIINWGEANGFVQLGDADVKKINESKAIYLVRNPNGRLPKQIQTVTKRFSTAHGKEPMAEWNDTEELMLETLQDEPKDWYSINPVYLQTQTAASERYKNINWKFIKLDNFSKWALENGYKEFELFPENADPELIALITLFLEESGVESLYKEDFDLYEKI
tara:strand:- start:504 stop:1043 length:540 start_codon:yes stop_codon:yes gene_type:complete